MTTLTNGHSDKRNRRSTCSFRDFANASWSLRLYAYTSQFRSQVPAAVAAAGMSVVVAINITPTKCSSSSSSSSRNISIKSSNITPRHSTRQPCALFEQIACDTLERFATIVVVVVVATVLRISAICQLGSARMCVCVCVNVIRFCGRDRARTQRVLTETGEPGRRFRFDRG